MAISSNHYIELYIQDQLIELESQDSLNLRINNILFNPTKTTTTQAEYSYSFDIPSTPNNDKILNYANNLSKINKFHARYKAQVYADGQVIFDGSLTIQKYSAKDKKYTCNLVNIKQNSLEEIFGEEVMTSLHWDVPFSGAPTINEVNADLNNKYFFPLVCYGVFQKDYVMADSVGATYTPKSTIDKYNKWWIESFYPSLNVVETLRKAFQSKGYNVGGSAFSDPNICNIYASCNLASEQAPVYNLGNPKFGRLRLNITWNNFDGDNGESSNSNDNYLGTRSRNGSEYSHANSTGGLSQDLKFPYEHILPSIRSVDAKSKVDGEYNFSTITFWNMMDSTNNPSGVTVTLLDESYMYDPNENLIVIPSDGWYKIDLSCQGYLKNARQEVTVQQWTNTFWEDEPLEQRDVVLSGNNATFKTYFPLEIQLIRNYDDNIELIKGKKNVEYATGDPNQESYRYDGDSYTGSWTINKSEWLTEFPHQDLYGSKTPTKLNSLLNTTVAARNEVLVEYKDEPSVIETPDGNDGDVFNSGGGRRAPRRNSYGRTGQDGATHFNTYGFMHKDGEVMPYDQAVSPAFICGFSTMGGGQASVMRNGKSWSALSTINNKILSNVLGLQLLNKTSNGTGIVDTNYCSNTYNNAPSATFTMSDNTFSGSLSCCVYLNKNDLLELCAIQRDFDGQAYSTSASCSLDITAVSKRSETELRGDLNWGYYSASEFPRDLNLFEFTNKETKISDWISNIQKAFNLEIVQEGNSIDINTNKGIKKDITYAVDIDDRVSSHEATSEFISYPKSMAVKYKINTSEYGFELTVPKEHINDEDWMKYGDSGYTVIELNDDSYETSKQETTTDFSYTYYMDFAFTQQYSDGTSGDTETLRMPVIELSEYMAEGYGYDEAMKHDGYSFAQRFWYRQPLASTPPYVILSDHMREDVDITVPVNSFNSFNLSYKDTENSIATMYFNIHPMLSSNYVSVDVYLTPEEYKEIKDGALVHFDSDLYYTSEISGYDPSGHNPTTLKLIKKI